MKVLILGATGRAGTAAARALHSLKGVERVFLADRDAEALSKVGAYLGRFPASPRYLDAESERSLRERMVEADLVLGCLGPSHLHEARVVEAALATGRDYLSLCDDPAATMEALALHAEAERRGVRLLLGCGMTPGLSNLLACRASCRMRGPFSLRLDWYLDMGAGLGAATLEHLLRVSWGKVDTRMDGRAAKARAGGGEELVDFPPPIGPRTVGLMGHPEPNTLPARMAEAHEIEFKGGIGGKFAGFALQTLAWIGEGREAEPRLTVLRAAARGVARRSGGSCASALRVTASNGKAGAGAEVVLAVCGDYYRVSATVLVAAAAWLAGRGWPAGALTPEGVLDHPGFFALLRRRGLPVLVGERRAAQGGDACAPLTA